MHTSQIATNCAPAFLFNVPPLEPSRQTPVPNLDPQYPNPLPPPPREFLELGYKYDNLLMEESGQILEIETFIPMLLQACAGGRGGEEGRGRAAARGAQRAGKHVRTAPGPVPQARGH